MLSAIELARIWDVLGYFKSNYWISSICFSFSRDL